MANSELRKLIRKRIRFLFERTFTTPLYGGGMATSDVGNYSFGYKGFDELPEEERIEIATNMFNRLKSSYYGNEEKAMENMPDYMLLYI